jgi:peptidoglycan/LPS O-acetylase OafA/YrhL
LLDNVFSAFLILSFLTLEGVRIPGATTLARLGGMAYGIYLMHVPVVELAARGLYHVAPRLLAFPLAIFLLVGAAGVAVPVLAMTILRQPGPNRVYAYVFG